MSQSEAQNCLSEFYSRINEFRADNKHTDITIVIDDEFFKCHRVVLSAASEYFDTLFSSGFNDSFSDSIKGLNNVVSAETFKEILQFIYTGSVTVTSDNVYDVLQASDFLGLRRLENFCVLFVEKNMPIRHAVELYIFACRTKKTGLADFLYPYVVGLFEEFSKTDSFLEMPFDALVTMLNQCTSAKEDTILLAINRWINHSREERLQYADVLIKSVQVTNLSPSFLRSMIKNCLVSDTRVAENWEQEELSGLQEATDGMSLYVYVQNDEGNENTYIFFVNCNTYDCDPSCRIVSSNIRRVAFSGSMMYCLEWPNQTNIGIMELELSAWLSLDSKRILASPTECPSYDHIYFHESEFCGMKQNEVLYLYNKKLLSRLKSRSSYGYNSKVSNLSSYNCKRDCWSTLRMHTEVDEASMTAFSDTLYFIGGQNPDSRVSNLTGYVQAYDYCRSWRELPRSHYNYKNAVSCAFNEKLYVCSATGENCETYDIRASKWEIIESLNLGKNSYVQKILPFSNKLWFFVNFKNESGYCNDFRVYLYDPVSNKWSNYSMLNRVVEKTSSRKGFYIADAVVFRSP